jgi:hypothetical protein
VHHGDGTQELFLDNPNVLVFSVHRYDHGTFYPESNRGAAEVVGEGPGRFFNVNVPWNLPAQDSEAGGGSHGDGFVDCPGDAEYLAAFDLVIQQPVFLKYESVGLPA